MNWLKSIRNQPSLIARLVYTISLVQLLAAGFGFIVFIIWTGENLSGLIITGSLAIVSGVTLLFLRRGNINLSSYIFLGGMWLSTTLAVAVLGGPQHPFAATFILVVVMTGFVLGKSSIFPAFGLNLAVLLLLGLLSQQNLITDFQPSLTASLVIISIQSVYLAAVIYLVVQEGQNSLVDINSVRHSLEESQRELQISRQFLEERVTERTTLIEHRANQLQVVIEISQAVHSYLEPKPVMTTAVEKINERFSMYHTGLFVLNADGEWLDLLAAAGAGSQALVGRKYRLRLGSGMVGWVALNAQSRLAQSVGDDAVRLDTPELPDARSEAVFPLRARGRVLGALSVQSTRPNAFDQNLMYTLQSLADEVGLALDNAQLMFENQVNLQAARISSTRSSQQEWQTLLAERQGILGYRWSNGKLEMTPPETDEQMDSVISTGLPNQTQVDGQSILTLPLRIREQTIGVMRFRKPELEGASSTSWSADEQQSLERMLDQVGQAIESARLYGETRRRAAQEQIASQVTARIRETLDIETVLKTAVQEVQRALGLPEVIVRLVPPVEAGIETGQDVPAQIQGARPPDPAPTRRNGGSDNPVETP